MCLSQVWKRHEICIIVLDYFEKLNKSNENFMDVNSFQVINCIFRFWIRIQVKIDNFILDNFHSESLSLENLDTYSISMSVFFYYWWNPRPCDFHGMFSLVFVARSPHFSRFIIVLDFSGTDPDPSLDTDKSQIRIQCDEKSEKYFF